LSGELLLVGSIPLETAEQVFRSFGGALGRWLDHMPDGEIGGRRYWIDHIAHTVLNGHPELETVRRPAPDENGIERWRPRGNHDNFQFRVRPEVKRVRFGDPGWRLGYTRDAISSFYVFRDLKSKGVIPRHVRFQVCVPATYSLLGSHFPDRDDLEKVVPGMTEALATETAEIARQIPPDQLTIQWDLAVENRLIERQLASGDAAAARDEAERVTRPLAEICADMPGEVALGYHSCFGTLDGWPSRQPPDLTGTVLLLNASIEASGRKVDFVHFPTTGSTDEGYFRPLADLKLNGTRAYVGAIHHMHGAPGMGPQLATVRKFLPAFGLAAPCGFGRAPERPGRLLTESGDRPPPDVIQVILDDHRTATEFLARL